MMDYYDPNIYDNANDAKSEKRNKVMMIASFSSPSCEDYIERR